MTPDLKFPDFGADQPDVQFCYRVYKQHLIICNIIRKQNVMVPGTLIDNRCIMWFSIFKKRVTCAGPVGTGKFVAIIHAQVLFHAVGIKLNDMVDCCSPGGRTRDRMLG